MTAYRIRPCDGNKAAWLLCRLNDDGSEATSYGSYTTSMSLDTLLENAGGLTPKPLDTVEFVARTMIGDAYLAPIVSPARYAGRWNGKPQCAVRCPSDGSGMKTRAMRLAGALKARYSRREDAYIMSPTKAAKLVKLYAEGRDANFFTLEFDLDKESTDAARA